MIRLTPKEKVLIRDSNYGRWLGWDVLSNDIVLCSLSFHSMADQYWDLYVISDILNDIDPERDLFWDNSQLVFRSRAVPALSLPTNSGIICRWLTEERKVSARGLYLDTQAFQASLFHRLLFQWHRY